MVNGALMFGREREQAGMLIEPHPDHAVDPNDEVALAEFRNKIWSVAQSCVGGRKEESDCDAKDLLSDGQRGFSQAASVIATMGSISNRTFAQCGRKCLPPC